MPRVALLGEETSVSRFVLIALVLPPIALGAAMWLLLAYPLRSIPLGELGWFGTRAQLVGLVTMFLPIVTLVVGLGWCSSNGNRKRWRPTWALLLETYSAAWSLAGTSRRSRRCRGGVRAQGSLGEFVIVDKLVGPNNAQAVGPILLATVTNASPRVNAVGTTLAITAGMTFALLAWTFAAVFKQ